MTEDLKTRIENIYALEDKVQNCVSGNGTAADYEYLVNCQFTKAPEMVDIIRSLEAKVAQLEERLNDK